MLGVPVLWRPYPEIAHSRVGRQGSDQGSAKYRRLMARGLTVRECVIPAWCVLNLGESL